jgi:hypothetical protein
MTSLTSVATADVSKHREQTFQEIAAAQAEIGGVVDITMIKIAPILQMMVLMLAVTTKTIA